MSEYTQRLAQLGDEEQAIYRQERIEHADRQRLEQIAAARALLWNAERARKAGAPLAVVPLEGWPSDQVGGYRSPRPRRDRSVERPPRAPGAKRDLPPGVERMESGRVRAVCFLRDRTKISFGTFDPSPEQIDLAGRMTAAARAARDAGRTSAEIRAAALAVYAREQHEEGHSYAAD